MKQTEVNFLNSTDLGKFISGGSERLTMQTGRLSGFSSVMVGQSTKVTTDKQLLISIS